MEESFICNKSGCDLSFSSEDHLNMHLDADHAESPSLSRINTIPTFVADQTPTPTRFLKTCEEAGLFQLITNPHANPFDEAFQRGTAQNERERETENSGINNTSAAVKNEEDGTHREDHDGMCSNDDINYARGLSECDESFTSDCITMDNDKEGSLNQHMQPLDLDSIMSPGEKQLNTSQSVESLPVDTRQYIEVYVHLADGQLVPMQIPVDALMQATPSPSRPIQSTASSHANLQSVQSQQATCIQVPKVRPANISPAALLLAPAALPRLQSATLLDIKPTILPKPAPALIQSISTSVDTKSSFINQVASSAPQIFTFQSPPVLIQKAGLSPFPLRIIRPATLQPRPTILRIVPNSTRVASPISAGAKTVASGNEAVSRGGGIMQSTKQRLREALQLNQSNLMNSTQGSAGSQSTIVLHSPRKRPESGTISNVSYAKTPKLSASSTVVVADASTSDCSGVTPSGDAADCSSDVAPVSVASSNQEYIQLQAADTSTHLTSPNGSIDDENEYRRRRFLESNRAAATRCRNKKKTWVNTLEWKATELQNQNRLLQTETMNMKIEIAALKQTLLDHVDCPGNSNDIFLVLE